jgi:hypothetical protein
MRPFLLLAALASCFPANSAVGSLTITGDTRLASMSDAFTTCAKVGDLDGIELSAASGPVVRVNRDDVLGDSLEIADGTNSAQLASAQCSQLSVDVHHNGYRISTDSEVAGSFDAECTLANGGTLSAHATFDGCL